MIAFGIYAVANRVAGFFILNDFCHFRFHEFHIRIGFDLLVEIFEAVNRANIDVVNGRLTLIAKFLSNVIGLLERGHAANA